MKKNTLNKKRMLEIFSWSKFGLDVLQILASLGFASIVKVILTNVINVTSDLAWYENLYLFISTFLIMLGIFNYKRLRKLTRQIKYKSLLEISKSYTNQRENWRHYIQLKCVCVDLKITSDVPHINFTFMLVNYLPVKIKLVKVVNSSGVVSVGILGHCEFGYLPETINEGVSPRSDRTFEKRLDIQNTKLPNFLNDKHILCKGNTLQWMLKGEWYIEAYGEMELWEAQSYGIRYDQIISDRVAL